MKTIQVRNVPDDVHAAFRRRAAESGMSLQEYLRAELVRIGSNPTVSEVLRRAASRRGGSASGQDVVDGIREDRDTR